MCVCDPAALPALHQSPTSPTHTMRLQSAIPPYAQHAARMQKAALRFHTRVCVCVVFLAELFISAV